MSGRGRGLALLFATSIGITLTACSSSSSTGAGTSSAAPSNAAASTATASAGGATVGYKRIGDAASGISIEVPTSWTDANMAEMSPEAAASKFHMSGVSSSELVQSLQSLQKSHGVYAADEASATGPEHFARNMNAYCLSSGTTKSGADGVSILAASAKSQLSSIASDITQQDLTVGGVPGVETSYKTATSSGTLTGSQLEVLPAAGKVCFVTLTVSKSESAGAYLATAASTAQFYK